MRPEVESGTLVELTDFREAAKSTGMPMPLKTRKCRPSRSILAAVVALSLGALTTPAQVDVGPAATVPAPQQRGGLNPDSFYAKEPVQGVSVRDSLEAIKKLEDARRMERLGDWNKAADWYQEVLEKLGDRVVPSGVDKEGRQSQYTGIERPVQEQLAKWPKDGLAAYKNRYGPVARTMLDQARRDDRETLSKVMKLYFVTDAAREAAIRLIDLLLENGEFPEAARVGDRLLDWHPSLEADRPKVLFRTALAYHLSGDAKKAKERAEQMSARYADATGSLFGKDVILADALGRLLQQAPPVSVATATGSIRLNPGGDESRSQVMPAAARSGARIASVELADPPVPKNIPPQQLREMEQFGRLRDNSANLGIMPVVDDEELYFQDGSRIYAVSVQSGVPLPGWIQSYPSTNGQYIVNSWGPMRGQQQQTLTLTDQYVLAVMGVPDRLSNYGFPTYGERGTRIVCLNRSDGKEKWVFRKDKLPNDTLRGLDFSGSPLVVGDNVYVIGRGGKNLNAEDCYVLCFDLTGGTYKWSCFIASANNNYAFMGQVSTGDTLSHLAYSSGRVFVLTNLGACAALDAYSGTISWLNIYQRDTTNFNPEMGWRPQGRGAPQTPSVQAWEYSPVIVRDGKVFVLPTDGRHILVYDAGTGVEVKRFALSDFAALDENRFSEQSTPQALLAVDGSHLIICSEKAVYCIDWQAQVDGGVRQAILWKSDFPSRIRGRPFVTSDSVFVSTETTPVGKDRHNGQLFRVERFNAAGKITGRIKESYPSNGREWDTEGGEGTGNVVVTGDQVIIATANRVNVYADMDLARKRLDDDVAAAPGDPKPRLRYAEVMFVAGELPVAMEKLNEAIGLLGGLKSLRPGTERDHLFNDCITFAFKLQKDKKLEDAEERVNAINKLYDLAGDAASGDSQQVNYRISRARFNREFQQPNSLTEAVRLYQEILTNPKLRIVPLAEEEGTGATQAALVAEKSIADVMKVKPEAYQQFEEQAATALQAAGKDPAALKAVAESYPNSASAAKAMIAAAQAYEQQSNHRLATHTLRQAYAKYAQTQGNDVKVRLLEGMARNYLAIPDRVDVTAARLSAVVRLGKESDKLEKPLALPGGKVLVEAGTTFGQALKAVQTYTTQAAAAKLPDFRMPPPLTDEQKEAIMLAQLQWQEGQDPAKRPVIDRTPFLNVAATPVIEDVDALLLPPRELRGKHARHDRVVAWSNGNLAIYGVGSREPLGRSSLVTEQPRYAAWVDEGKSLLAWGDTQVVMVAGANADKKWKVDLKALPRIDVIAGGAATDQTIGANENAGGAEAEQVFPGGQRMILRRRVINGRMVQQWQAVPPQVNPAPVVGGAEQILHVRLIDDRIIVATSAGQLLAVKAADGSLAWHTRLSQASPIIRMAATDDFVVSLLADGNSRQIVAVDTLTGQLVKRFTFGGESSGNVPVNLALAPDGMLVWITPDRLCGKDLFEPSKDLNYGDGAAADADELRARGAVNPNIAMNGQPVGTQFAGAVNPDQLVISEGRVIVVAMDGRMVELHSLESGRLLDYKQASGQTAEARLVTASNNGTLNTTWNVSLNLVGTMLYVTSATAGPVAYDLDSPKRTWSGSVEVDPQTFDYQDPMIDPTFLVVLSKPARAGAVVVPGPGVRVPPGAPPPAPQPGGMPGGVGGQAQAQQQEIATTWRFHAYSRVKPKGPEPKESGVLTYSYDLREDAGISEFQPVDGGFYYLTGDRKLKLLRGARQ
jgi:outer membrane protein assembly factor BamB